MNVETGTRSIQMYKWYNRPDVKFEIIKHTVNRESSFLVPSYLAKRSPQLKITNTRMLKIHSVQHLDFWFKCLHIYDKQKIMNFYSTVGHYYNGIPNQSGNLSQRTHAEKKDWLINHHKQLDGYDFLIDIDADAQDELEYAHESATMIKAYFDSLNIPYELRFSGRGFHFIIAYRFLPQEYSLNPNDDKNLFKLLGRIATLLKEKYSEMVDTSLYDSRRLCKCPYSLAHYDDGIFICTPILTHEEFKNFTPDLYNLDNFVGDVRSRGTYIFNESGNFRNLIKSLRIYGDGRLQ